jgi:hypothetical protein
MVAKFVGGGGGVGWEPVALIFVLPSWHAHVGGVVNKLQAVWAEGRG